MIEVEESCEFEGSVGRRSSSRGARRKKREAYDEKTMKDNLYAFISGEGEATPLSKNMPRATSSNAKETKEMKEIDFLSYLLVPPSITLILTLIRKEDMDTR